MKFTNRQAQLCRQQFSARLRGVFDEMLYKSSMVICTYLKRQGASDKSLLIRCSMENALRVNPQDVREQYEKQLKDLQEAYGEAMLELRTQKKWQSLLGEDEK